MKTHSVVVRKDKEHLLIKGHPWVYKEAFVNPPKNVKTGDIFVVKSFNDRYIGKGLVDVDSKIYVRMINCKADEAIKKAIVRHIRTAFCIRKTFFNPEITNSFRLINGEGDGIPGLIVDRYSDAVSIQIYTLALEPHIATIKQEILNLLPKTKWIWRRNQIRLANSNFAGLIHGKKMPSKIVFLENGMKFSTDLVNGQKTGFFLDQRSNRDLIRKISKGKSFLNICGYTGAFTVAAAIGGAKESVTVDIANPALEEAKTNFQLNNINQQLHRLECADMYKYLESHKPYSFDLVVLDPPSMAKNRKDLTKAMRAYRKLNKLGLKQVKNGGYLFTASCSSQLTREAFFDIIKEISGKSGRKVRVIHESFHAPDHPINIIHTEGRYLKALLLEVN